MKRVISAIMSLILVFCIIGSTPLVAFADYQTGYGTLCFSLNEDGISYGVSGYVSPYVNECVIPAEYNGLPVTKICSNAFDYNDGCRSVVIPETVTHIEYRAFYDCTKLNTITIPSNVTYIGNQAFWGCSINNVYISDVGAYCNINFEGEYSNPMEYAEKIYLNNQPLENLVIPDGVTRIPSNSFNDESIVSITIPDSVERIGKNTFSDTQYYNNTENWEKIATVKGNSKIKYLDETPRKGVTYRYRIKAYYSKSTSAYSSDYKVTCKY